MLYEKILFLFYNFKAKKKYLIKLLKVKKK